MNAEKSGWQMEARSQLAVYGVNGVSWTAQNNQLHTNHCECRPTSADTPFPPPQGRKTVPRHRKTVPRHRSTM